MNAYEFEMKTGYKPIQDDLERVNCEHAGEIGHQSCGWCYIHDKPVFQCPCHPDEVFRVKQSKDILPYKVTDIRFTQSHGWVMDGYLVPDAILPVSVPFDYHMLYEQGFCFNFKRMEIKMMFEKELHRMWKEMTQ